MAETIISLIVGNDTSTYVQEFTPAIPVSNFHTLPRFSHTDDFALLFSSDPDEVKDYSLGLLFIAFFIMSFFTVWLLLICLFKCIGPKHMKVFSGHPFRSESTFSTIARSIFAFSSVMVIIFSIVCVTQGLTEVQTTADQVDATNHDVMKIHDEFVRISTSLNGVSRAATPVRDQLVSFLKDDVCPLAPGSATEMNIRQIGRNTLDALEDLSNFIEDELIDVDNALKTVQKTTEYVDKVVQKTSFTGPAAAAVMIPYFIVPALLLVTLLMGWFEVYSEAYYSFSTWFLMPLFVLMVIFAYVATGWAALSTEGNADFCSGGATSTPEGTIQRALWQHNLNGGQLYYDAMMFYSNQCQTDSPWEFLEDYYGDLIQAKITLEKFAETVAQVTPEQLSQECGAHYGPTLQLLNQMQTYTSILLESSLRSIELVSCDRIVPLYTSTIYEGTCETSITGITWIFASFFTISFFGMLMIMFRGACYPIWYDDGKSVGEYSSTSDDADLQEEVSGEEESEYVDGSQVDGSQAADYEDNLTNALENGATDEDYSAYGESQYTEENSANQ